MVLRYGVKGEFSDTSYTEIVPTKEWCGDRLYYKADITNLESGTEYVYKIGDTIDNKWSELYSFTTEPEISGDFSFIAVTDPQGSNQSNYDLFKQTVDAAFEDRPESKFMFSLGDMVELGYVEEYWDMYFDAIDEYCTDIPNMAIIGNHETRDDSATSYYDAGLQFRLHFNNDTGATKTITDNISESQLSNECSKGVLENIAGSVYSFDYGNVHIAALNSSTDWNNADTLNLVEAQADWLAEDLENSDAMWKIVLIHQGLYPAKEARYFGLRDVLEGIIDGCGVDLVLQGHDHMVARTYPMKNGSIVTKNTPESVDKGEGAVYYIPGAAANKRYSDVGKPDYMATLTNTAQSQPTYTVFDVSDEMLSAFTYQLDGTLVDSFSIVGK